MPSPVAWKDKMIKKEYQNWLAVGHSLLLMCDGVRPYVEREMKAFHAHLLATLASLPPCACSTSAKHSNTCAWATQLKRYHRRGTPTWKQSDRTKWTDPNLGYWEIAKLYMSDLGPNPASVLDAESTDTTGLSNLMYWCNFFKVPHSLVDAVRQTRNAKWGHAANQELSDVEKTDAIATVKNLLNDPELAGNPNVRDSLAEIDQLEKDFDLQSVERQVLLEAVRTCDSLAAELKEFQTRIARVEKDSKLKSRKSNNILRKGESLKIRLKRSKKQLDPRLRCAEGRQIESNTLTVNVGKVIAIPFAMLYGKFLSCVFIILMCCVLLDHNSPGDGCPKEESPAPFQLQELINFTSYLNMARENFVGRAWLFKEIEETFSGTNDYPSAVIVTGEPGAGKSAVAAQLICSRSTSASIHGGILGYHLCKYSDKDTLDGGKFVRNLVDMISRRMPEYGRVIADSHWIQRALQRDRCAGNPKGCFEETIVLPLEMIKHKVDKHYFIVIDALDECVIDSSGTTGQITSGSIVEIIRDKIPRLPKWVKWIITSRNDSTTFKYFQNTFIMNLRSLDQRNLQDIEIYLMAKLSLRSLGPMFGLSQGNDQVTQLISTLLSKSQGNFLFVREMLHFLQNDHSSARQPSLPSSLGGIYESYLQRTYGSSEKFTQVRNILEIVIASLVPMSLNDIYKALLLQKPNLDRDYDFMHHLKSLEHFFRCDENHNVFLFHLSFAEWLTDEDNSGSIFYVNKRHGHNVLADHHFKIISESDIEAPYLLEITFRLAQHIAFGDKNVNRTNDFMRIPSERLNTSIDESGRTLLHLASSVRKSDVVRLVLPHFASIDLQDNRGFTPAFAATKNGFLENVAFLVSHGANINHKTPPPPKPPYLSLQDPILASKSEFWSSTLLHVAAQGGHLQVVQFLLEHNASFLETNAINLTSLQIAAEYGHLDIVRTLKGIGSQVDQHALYLAAKNGHATVVRYLLLNGVTDECMRCNGSLYWIDGGERYQALSMLSMRPNHPLYPMWEKWISVRRRRLKNNTNYTFFDDKHMIFCETALHAAVSNGHYEVTGILLSQKINALHCTDYTGRTPLHESVRRNNLQIMKRLLLANAKVNFKCNSFQNLPGYSDYGDMMFNAHSKFKHLSASEEKLYVADTCPCGSTSLHLAARYGNIQAAFVLRRYGASVFDYDCEGATPLHTAACHGHHTILQWFLESTPSTHINIPSVNGSSLLHSAAICGTYEELDRLLSMKANLSHIDKNGMSALHYAVLIGGRGKDDSNVDYPIPPSSNVGKEYFSTPSFGMWIAEKYVMYEYKFSWKTIEGNAVFDDQCRSVKKLVEHVGERRLNRPDNNGTSPLHLAAQNGLECATGILIANGGDTLVQNKLLKTPLDLAIENTEMYCVCTKIFSASNWERGFRETLSYYFRDHIAVVHILLARNTELHLNCRGGKPLHRAIEMKQPHIVLLLLLLGADAHCKDTDGRTPLVVYLQNGGECGTDIILKSYSEVTISCGIPFNRSELHLLAYHSPTLDNNNFFRTRICDVQWCFSIPGPLIKAIKTHPMKFKLLSSCRDAEGYTPLHRAAQGGNLVAIEEFLSQGARPNDITPSQQNSLTLAVQYARPGQETELRTNISLLLYKTMRRSNSFQIKCDASKAQLTVYHLAAYRGLERFIETVLDEELQQGLDINCADKYGFTPLYLAKLYAGIEKKGKPSPWDNIVSLIESRGGKLSFPKRRAEIHLLYTHLYGNCKDSVNTELVKTLNLLNNESSVEDCTRQFFARLKQKGMKEWYPLTDVFDELNVVLKELSRPALSRKIPIETALTIMKELAVLMEPWRHLAKSHSNLKMQNKNNDKVNEAMDNAVTRVRTTLREAEQSRKAAETLMKSVIESCHADIDIHGFMQSFVPGLSRMITRYRFIIPSKLFERIIKRLVEYEDKQLCHKMYLYSSRHLPNLLAAHFLACSSADISIHALKQTPFMRSRAPKLILDNVIPDLLSEMNVSMWKDVAYIADIMSKRSSEFSYLKAMTHMEDRSLHFTLKTEGFLQLDEMESNAKHIERTIKIIRKFVSPLIIAAQENNPNGFEWFHEEVFQMFKHVMDRTS